MPLYLMLVIVLALSGVLMGTLTAAYVWPRLAEHRIRYEPNRKLKGAKLYKRVFGNMVFSAALVFAFCYGLYDFMFTSQESSWWVMILQSLGILLIYDFLYYLLHRFAFHEWSVLRKVHVVHHAVRHPTAPDSLYLHPVENFLGLALLCACTILVGPVHPLTFAVVFMVYSALNIVVHCGLDVPRLGLRAVSFMARKHDIHHTSMKGGNYASITPLWDVLFGTAE